MGLAKTVFTEDPTATTYPGYQGRTGVTNYTNNTSDVLNGYVYINPALSGGITQKLNGIFSISPALSYELLAHLYNNSYTGLGGSTETIGGSVRADFSETYVLGGLNDATGEYITTKTKKWTAATIEKSWVKNIIEPSVALNATFSERFSFSANLTPNFTFINQSASFQTKSKEVLTYDDGSGTGGDASYVQTTNTASEVENTTIDTVSWNNELALGARIYLIPKKLRVNLETTVSNTLGTWKNQTRIVNGFDETETIKNWGTPNKPDDITYTPDTTVSGSQQSHSRTITSNGSLSTSYVAGITWFYDDNLSMDLKSNAGGDIWTLSNWTLQLNISY